MEVDLNEDISTRLSISLKKVRAKVLRINSRVLGLNIIHYNFFI